jgi:hypothetical protein
MMPPRQILLILGATNGELRKSGKKETTCGEVLKLIGV